MIQTWTISLELPFALHFEQIINSSLHYIGAIFSFSSVSVVACFETFLKLFWNFFETFSGYTTISVKDDYVTLPLRIRPALSSLTSTSKSVDNSFCWCYLESIRLLIYLNVTVIVILGFEFFISAAGDDIDSSACWCRMAFDSVYVSNTGSSRSFYVGVGLSEKLENRVITDVMTLLYFGRR